uniref:OST-HTH associated domain-containing protein n=1 Tax=Zooxanthella nutricula TaxID=1333877 RepID=A0A7S2QK10_9DINO|mmetsp:Transcript_93741/g.286821  ORF Transcript_93741/g.286821 Transcript_93741/m.286821 type:complete len:548 (+) Transcript_93741:60-1703(+)
MATTLPEARKLAVHCRDVVAAIRSLYLDELKPVGRLVSRRLREHAAEAVESVDVDATPTVDPQRLLQICEGSRHIHVVKVAGHDFEAYLFGQPCVFVEVDSAEDPYPDELWAELAMRFNQCWLEGVTLPGQRYLCAQVLAGCRIPCLQGRSLGQVCHIVQLSVSRRSLLGYLDDRLVPFQHSEWFMRDCGAKAGLSFAHSGLRAATMDEVRAGVWTLLHTSPQHGVLTLSNLKRLFRQSFMLELSETALGHVRLQNLLRDPRFSNICIVDQGAIHLVRGGWPICYHVPGRSTLVSPAAPMMPPAYAVAPDPFLVDPVVHAPHLSAPPVDTEVPSAVMPSPLAEPPGVSPAGAAPPGLEALGPPASVPVSPHAPPSSRSPRHDRCTRSRVSFAQPALAETLPQTSPCVPSQEPPCAEPPEGRGRAPTEVPPQASRCVPLREVPCAEPLRMRAPADALPHGSRRVSPKEPLSLEPPVLPTDAPPGLLAPQQAESASEQDDIELDDLSSTCHVLTHRTLSTHSTAVVGKPSCWSIDDDFDYDRSDIQPYF